jgi:hypothetical protein
LSPSVISSAAGPSVRATTTPPGSSSTFFVEAAIFAMRVTSSRGAAGELGGDD